MPVVISTFTAAQVTDIRRFCGYGAYSAYGYILSPEMSTLDTQLANMSTTEVAVVVAKLTNLYPLETAISSASPNLATDIAGVWTHNKNEVADRVALFNYWRRDLCEFIKVPPGPNLGGSGSRVVRT